MSNLLSDRSVLTLRSSLELSVERVGEVFDVQNCHRVPPKLLHNGGLTRDLSRPLLAPKNFRKCLRSSSSSAPATSESVLSPFPKSGARLGMSKQSLNRLHVFALV